MKWAILTLGVITSGTNAQIADMTQIKKGKKMKMTAERARVIRLRYEELLSLAAQFAGGSSNSDSIRFDYAGNIERYTNHACHCHPEYWWEQKKTAEEFGVWLDKRAAESTD